MENVESEFQNKLMVEDRFILGAKIKFSTNLSLEECRERILTIHANIPTGLFWYRTQINLDSINRNMRKKNKQGEDYYLTFNIRASLYRLFNLPHSQYLMTFYGQVNYLANDASIVVGEVQIRDMFTARFIIAAFVLVVLPSICLSWYLLSTKEIFSMLIGSGILLLILVRLYLDAKPVLNCKKQLIDEVYKTLAK